MYLNLLSFLLITLFYTQYFYKQVQLKKRNISTNRLSKGIKPKKTKQIESVLFILTYTTAFLQYITVFLFSYAFSLPRFLFTGMVGIFITIVGIIFFFFATINMKNNWRAGIDESQKTNLTTHGIYQFSRNPAFVGFDLFYTGIVLLSPNLFLLFFSFATIICLHVQILQEEAYLLKKFKAPYLDYKKRTPRYLFIK